MRAHTSSVQVRLIKYCIYENFSTLAQVYVPCNVCLLRSAGPTGPDGRLSNFGHFHNCTFTGNVAREYGAAIGAIALLFFQDMVDLLPLEIDSW